MRKTTKLFFGKSILALIALFLSTLSYSQCVNTTQFGSATSNNSGTVQTVSTCTYSSEFNNITGLIVGQNYIFTAQLGDTTGAHRYVSITDVNNVSIAHGPSPLIVNGITATAVRLHVSDNAACGQTSACHTTTVQFLASCPAPISLGVNSITTSGAVGTWTPVGPGTSWDVQYGVSGFTLGSGTIATNIAVPTYTFTGLMASTTYQYYVKSNCATEASIWAGPFSFPTTCAPVTEFYENFDTTTATFGGPLPICWTKVGLTNNIYLQGGTTVPMTAPNRLYMYSSNFSSTQNDVYAVMPALSNLQADTHRLRFTAYGSTADRVLYVGYLSDPNDLTSFTYLDEFVLPSTQVANATQFILDPLPLPLLVQRLVFRSTSAPEESSTIYIDDVRWEPIPTCLEPSNVSVSSILATTANVDWNAPTTAPASGYEYFVSTTSTSPTAATVATGSVAAGITTVALTALTPVSTYFIWVRSVCSTTSKSVWSLGTTFATPCASYVPDYTENFSTFTFSTPPSCWGKFQDGDPSTGPTGNPNTGSWGPDDMLNVTGNTAARINLYSNFPKGWMVSPVFDLTAGGYQVRYDVGTTQWNQTGPINGAGVMGGDDTVQFLMSTNGGTTWVPLVTYNSGNTPGNSSNSEVFNIPTVTSNAVKFAYYASSGSVSDGPDYDFFIDNFSVLTIPTCTEPTAVTFSAVLATSATVSWTAPASAPANGYEYFVTTSSTAPTSATVATGTVAAGVTTVSLTALTPTTQYYVWVRSVCSTTSKSIWIGGSSFTTPCASFVPYYLQDFSTFTFSALPSCWDKIQDGTLATGPTGATNTGSWFNRNYLNSNATPANTAAVMNIYSNFAKGWLVSPVFNLTAGGYQVKYNVGTTQYFSTNPINAPGVMGADDFVYFVMSTDGGTTWTTLQTYNTANTPNNLGTTAVFNIPTTTSASVKFAFYGTTGAIADAGLDYDFFIDDFIVQTIPVVPPACPTNVVATIAPSCGNFPTAISWNASASADGYKLSIGTTAGGTDILNQFVVNGLSYSFTGAINTTYYYKVVSYNVNGNSTGCTEQSFTTAATGCYCVANPSSNDALGITSVTLGTTNFPTGDVTYFDHTATVVNMNQAANTNVLINFATGYGYWSWIWIDFNDNFTFEASELVYSGPESSNANPTAYNASFIMPATATLGLHTMRLGTGDDLTTANPCYNGPYGVFLDFKVNIQPALGTDSFDSANFSAYPNPVKDILNISYNNTISDVSVYNLLGQLVLSAKPSSNEYQINMSQLTVGTYLVKVTSDNQVKTVKVLKN